MGKESELKAEKRLEVVLSLPRKGDPAAALASRYQVSASSRSWVLCETSMCGGSTSSRARSLMGWSRQRLRRSARKLQPMVSVLCTRVQRIETSGSVPCRYVQCPFPIDSVPCRYVQCPFPMVSILCSYLQGPFPMVSILCRYLQGTETVGCNFVQLRRLRVGRRPPQLIGCLAFCSSPSAGLIVHACLPRTVMAVLGAGMW